MSNRLLIFKVLLAEARYASDGVRWKATAEGGGGRWAVAIGAARERRGMVGSASR